MFLGLSYEQSYKAFGMVWDSEKKGLPTLVRVDDNKLPEDIQTVEQLYDAAQAYLEHRFGTKLLEFELTDQNGNIPRDGGWKLPVSKSSHIVSTRIGDFSYRVVVFAGSEEECNEVKEMLGSDRFYVTSIAEDVQQFLPVLLQAIRQPRRK